MENTNKIEVGNNGLPDIKELLKSGNIQDALKVLGGKIETGIENTKVFLQDLFRIREKTRNLTEEDTEKIEDILGKYLITKV